MKRNKTAILIEGLFSYNAGFVRNVYKAPLKALGYTVISLPWNTKELLIADVIIGHSFGGKTAMGLLAAHILITMDVRGFDFWNNDRRKSDYVITRHVNFYQTSGLRGYPIKSAENHDMGRAGHPTLPKVCFDTVMGIVKEQT